MKIIESVVRETIYEMDRNYPIEYSVGNVSERKSIVTIKNKKRTMLFEVLHEDEHPVAAVLYRDGFSERFMEEFMDLFMDLLNED